MNVSSQRNVTDLFRRAALQGANEAPFIDNLSVSQKSAFRFLLAIFSLIVVFGSIGALTLVAIPVTYQISATLSWDPEVTAVRAIDAGTIEKAIGSNQRHINTGMNIAIIKSAATFQPDITTHRQIENYDARAALLEEILLVISELQTQLSKTNDSELQTMEKIERSFTKVAANYRRMDEQLEQQARTADHAAMNQQITRRLALQDNIAELRSRIDGLSASLNVEERRAASLERQMAYTRFVVEVSEQKQRYTTELIETKLKKEKLLGLQGREVRAPVSGTLVSMPLTVGQTFQPGDVLFKIRPENSVPAIKATLPSNLVAQIRKGTMVNVYFKGVLQHHRLQKPITDIVQAADNHDTVAIIRLASGDIPDGLVHDQLSGTGVELYVSPRTITLIDFFTGEQ